MRKHLRHYSLARSTFGVVCCDVVDGVAQLSLVWSAWPMGLVKHEYHIHYFARHARSEMSSLHFKKRQVAQHTCTVCFAIALMYSLFCRHPPKYRPALRAHAAIWATLTHSGCKPQFAASTINRPSPVAQKQNSKSQIFEVYIGKILKPWWASTMKNGMPFMQQTFETSKWLQKLRSLFFGFPGGLLRLLNQMPHKCGWVHWQN